LKRHWMHPRPGLANLWPEKVLSYMLYMISYMISLPFIWCHIWYHITIYETSYHDIMLCLWYHSMILFCIYDIISWYHCMISYSLYDIIYDIMSEYLLVTHRHRFLLCPRGNMNWF
jgi:hypothetical protein